MEVERGIMFIVPGHPYHSRTSYPSISNVVPILETGG